ncbi:rRNA methyltransferase 2, mitochondrial [[Candida] railenensis]|uniref:rRNA methyltransferase 2, mitochondrial n=1 Tax=[Candida] railenensis TaxID=45579 RepID=A0A9P0W0Y0_9ASCO|nr:rRNA methyltransferase 2, mitochondrial [[Candida] railenensis]
MKIALQPNPLLIRHSSTSSKKWLNRQMNDKFTKDAKASNYRSRAAFKLIELDKKFSLFSKTTKNIIDLGFAPGAWSQVALERSRSIGIVNPNILGIDLIKCNPPEGVHFVQGDVFTRETQDKIREHFSNQVTSGVTSKEPESESEPESVNKNRLLPVNLILSDMMANTSGVKNSDHFASMDLCTEALKLAIQLLQPKGNLVMKFYTGKEESLLKEELDRIFSKVYRFKPQACRKESKEMYFIGMKKKI